MYRETIIFKNKIFKAYDKQYFISANGDVYSNYCHKILKQYTDKDGYKRVDIHGKHFKIHKLVYLTWIGDIPEGLQINHKDDNKCNNNYLNLYAGSQAENMQDKFNNKHAVGHTYYLTVLNKDTNKILTFCPASDFISYSQHSCKNGSVTRLFTRNWFKKSYEIIEYSKIKNLKQFLELKGVTTMGDECNPVG